MSAKDDSVNHIILEEGRAVHPEDLRTLGSIKRADTLYSDFVSEKFGWNVTRNTDSYKVANHRGDRDAEEQTFFMGSNWSKISKNFRTIQVISQRWSASLIAISGLVLLKIKGCDK